MMLIAMCIVKGGDAFEQRGFAIVSRYPSFYHPLAAVIYVMCFQLLVQPS